MADTQEVQQLRRRARRRLVGAIALVLFLVIVPPMIMDLEPKPVTTDLNVEIPAQSRGAVKVPPPAKTDAVEAAKASPATPAPDVEKPAKPVAEASAKLEPEEAEKGDKAEKAKRPAPLAAVTADPRKAREAERAEAILKGEAFVVPLGAYANPENVKQLQAKLSRAGVKSYTESVSGGAGTQTRVAAGPFASREEAEQARQKLVALKGLGVVPGAVTARQ
jgi:DedD protein